MVNESGFIEQELFAKIHEVMPIFCVDLVIERGNKFLLMRRDVEPDKGAYWLPGGRLRRNETIMGAANRLAQGETGLSVQVVKFLDYTDCHFKADPFGHGKGTHTVSLVFLCRAVGGEAVADRNHTRIEWWDGVPRWNQPSPMPSVVEALIDKARQEVNTWRT